MKKDQPPWFYALAKDIDQTTLPPGFADNPLPWVDNARTQAVRHFCPPEFLTDAPPDTATLGKALGMLHALLNALEKPLTPEQASKLEIASQNLPATMQLSDQQLRQLDRQWTKFLRQFRKLIRKASDLAHAQGFAIAQDFERGYAEGTALVPADLHDETPYSRNQKLLLILTTLGPLAQTFPSVAKLHQAFVKGMGEPKAGDLKNFSHLCRKIGLKLRPPGRPRKIGTARMAPAHTAAR